jgi:hypothetical protein
VRNFHSQGLKGSVFMANAKFLSFLRHQFLTSHWQSIHVFDAIVEGLYLHDAGSSRERMDDEQRTH